jgi:hypothetical protein
MQHLVSIRERVVTDECGAQELDFVTVGQFVERGVRDRPAAGEHLAQDRRGRGPADPEPVKDGVRRPRRLKRHQIPAGCRDRGRITGAAHPRHLLDEVAVGAPPGRVEVLFGSAATTDLGADNPGAPLTQPCVRSFERRSAPLTAALAAGGAVQPATLAAAAHRLAVDAALHPCQAATPPALAATGHIRRSCGV